MNDLIQIDKLKGQIALIEKTEDGKQSHDEAETIRIYAKRRGMKSLEDEAAKARIHIEHRLGEIIPIEFPWGGDKSRLDNQTLDDVGISRFQSHRWQKVTGIPFDIIERYFAQAISKDESITTAGLLRFFSSDHVADDSYEWFTPRKIIAAVKQALGEITLDPATSEEAQTIIQAKHYYTSKDDGLSKPWFGNVFLNPPYNMPHIAKFTDKARIEYENNNIESVIVLTNNATDTDWFINLAQISVIAFTKGRLKFFNIDEKELATRQGQAFFYLGQHSDKFKEVFSRHCFFPNIL